ncbi:hypothetical protein M0P48_01635 [Candidatus Gracilibacteria bacterium]|nr:hypothetical protein [Candidatus Gracilibacteria bacterium]
MTNEKSPEETKKYTWENHRRDRTIEGDLRGFVLRDENGEFVGAVSQKPSNLGKWMFSSRRYWMGTGDFDDEEKAKTALLEDLEKPETPEDENIYDNL